MKTQAAVLVKTGSPLEIMELKLPSLAPGQVLVRLAYSGICATQLNEIRGLKGEDKFLPHTLGHEGSGVVLEAGKNVTKVKEGDRVVLSWMKGAGADVPNCLYDGKVNSGAISTFLTHAVVSENRVIPLPPEMPLREAALLGCAIPTGAGVVRHEMHLQKGQSFAVFGVGGVGLSALLAAKEAGGNPLIAVDLYPEKLAVAKAIGATHFVDARTQTPHEAIFALTNGFGVDFAFEAAGHKRAMEEAFASLKAPGGVCILAGNLPKGEKIAIDPFDLIRGKRILGTWGGSSRIDADVAHYANAYLHNQISLAPLITHEAPLDQINTLLEKLSSGQVGRALIAFS